MLLALNVRFDVEAEIFLLPSSCYCIIIIVIIIFFFRWGVFLCCFFCALFALLRSSFPDKTRRAKPSSTMPCWLADHATPVPLL